MTKFALVIAIPEYNNFSPLPKTTQDAEDIAQLLHNYGGYQITRLPHKGNKDTADYEMKAGKVTGSELYKELKQFLKKAQKRPSLIYFTGHGFTVCNEYDEEEGYLATSDCDVKFNNESILKQEHGFPLKRLNSLIKEADLSELVVLLDCCHSGHYIESTLMRQSLTTFEHKQNYYLITASRSSETAKTIRQDEHSVFSGAIIEGLSENSADTEGYISCSLLFHSVSRKIGGKLQTPLKMGIGDAIILVKHSLTVAGKNPEIKPIKDKQGNIICPYQGLNAFTAETEEFFYGRKQLTEDIKQALDQCNIIPIIGASGSGKSSVIYAGVIPWLEKENQKWCILETIKPGIEPLSALRCVFEGQVSLTQRELVKIIEDESKGIEEIIAALPNDKRYFLFIDQFEEVFTVCSSERQRKRFLDLITPVDNKDKSSLVIVTTMRADFLDRCLGYESLYEIIQRQTIYMPPLKNNDIKKIIVEPAQRQGFKILPDLLAQLLQEVSQEKNFLPLLEFALALLWEKRDQDKKVLTLQAYQQLGNSSESQKAKVKSHKDETVSESDHPKTGLTQALNIYAEKVYQYKDYYQDNPKQERSELEKQWVKLIFLRLIHTANQEKDTRQRLSQGTLLEFVEDNTSQREQLNELVYGEYGLVSSRLLVSGSDVSSTSSLNHETEGKKAINHNGSWVDLVHEALIEGWDRFTIWRDENRDLRRLGERLEEQRQEWLNNPIDENWMMGGLLMQVRQQWEKLHPSFLLYPKEAEAFYQQSDDYEKSKIKELEELNTAIENAKREQKKIETAKRLQQEGENALNQIQSNDYIQALLIAIKAGKDLIPLKEANGDYPASTPILALNILRYHQPMWIDWINNQDNTRYDQLIPHDLQVVTYDLAGGGGILTVIQFNHDHTRSIVVFTNHRSIAKVRDGQGNLLATLEGHQDDVNNAQFSPDGTKIVTASEDKTTKVWDSQGNLLATLEGHQDEVNYAEFSPDGSKIVTASEDKTAKVWDSQGNILATLEGHQDDVNNAQFSPDGTKIVTASEDKTAKVWDSQGNLLTTLEGHQDEVNYAEFSPDGSKIVTASEDKTAKVWDSQGNLLTTLAGHRYGVNYVQFSPDGSKIATNRVWDLSGNLLASLKNEESFLRFSPDGTRMANVSNHGYTANVFNLSGNLLISLELEDRINVLHFSQDGKAIITVLGETSVTLWPVHTLEELVAWGCEWLERNLPSKVEEREYEEICKL